MLGNGVVYSFPCWGCRRNGPNALQKTTKTKMIVRRPILILHWHNSVSNNHKFDSDDANILNSNNINKGKLQK